MAGKAGHMDAWDGGTRDEISFEDGVLWTSVFDGMRDEMPRVGPSQVMSALRRLGFVIDEARFAELWKQRLESLFDKGDDGPVTMGLSRSTATRPTAFSCRSA